MNSRFRTISPLLRFSYCPPPPTPHPTPLPPPGGAVHASWSTDPFCLQGHRNVFIDVDERHLEGGLRLHEVIRVSQVSGEVDWSVRSIDRNLRRLLLLCVAGKQLQYHVCLVSVIMCWTEMAKGFCLRHCLFWRGDGRASCALLPQVRAPDDVDHSGSRT